LVRPLSVVVVSGAMMQLGAISFNVLTPTLSGVFHATIGSVQWVIVGYMLMLSAVTPFAAWFSKRFGSRRTMLTCCGCYGIISLCAAFSPTIQALIALRMLQGAVGAMAGPIGTAISYSLCDKDNAGKIMGIIGIPIFMTPALGPLLSGWLADIGSWKLILLINVPLAAYIVISGLVWLPGERRRPAAGDGQTADTPAHASEQISADTPASAANTPAGFAGDGQTADTPAQTSAQITADAHIAAANTPGDVAGDGQTADTPAHAPAQTFEGLGDTDPSDVVGRPDILGMATAPVAVCALVYGFQNALTTAGLNVPAACIALVGLLALAVFVRNELTFEGPILRLALFKRKAFVNAVLTQAASMLLIPGFLFLLPLFFQGVYGWSAFVSGLIMLPIALASAVGLPFGGKAFDRHGVRRIIMVGFSCVVAGMTLFTLTQGLKNPVLIVAGFCIAGFGLGYYSTSLTTNVLSAAPTQMSKDSSTINATVMQLMNAVGTAWSTSILMFFTAGGVATGPAYFKAFAAVCVIGLVLTVLCLIGAQEHQGCPN
jgi:MFS family permease